MSDALGLEKGLIPGTNFTEEEANQLISLLGLVALDHGRWPTEKCMRAAHYTISYWAPEIVITRGGEGGNEILLVQYNGGVDEFRGKWCLPGGYNIGTDHSVQEACSRVAIQEIGVDVILIGVLHAEKWPKGSHPYGSPLSLFVECHPQGDVLESDGVRFFPVDKLPQPIIQIHREFIENLLRK